MHGSDAVSKPIFTCTSLRPVRWAPQLVARKKSRGMHFGGAQKPRWRRLGVARYLLMRIDCEEEGAADGDSTCRNKLTGLRMFSCSWSALLPLIRAPRAPDAVYSTSKLRLLPAIRWSLSSTHLMQGEAAPLLPCLMGMKVREAQHLTCASAGGLNMIPGKSGTLCRLASRGRWLKHSSKMAAWT